MIKNYPEIITEVSREVFNTYAGVSIKVGKANSCANSCSFVRVYTEGHTNKTIFNELDIILHWKFAKALGEALIACAKEMEDLK